VGGAAYGSFGLSPGTILNLYEIDLVAGTYQFDILNNNQGASLGMSVHPPLSPRQTPWHGKDDLRDGVAHARSAAPGGNVSVTVQVPYGAEGKWCLAVWKPAASDLLQTIGYDLSATGAPASPLCVTIDGTAEAAYGPAHAVQQLPTAFGDSDLGLPGEANGSELDQAFGKIADGNLYLAFTGNLESNLNDLEIFLDVMPGGQHRLLGNNVVIADDALGRMGDDGSGNGLTFDSGFEADAYLTVSCGETPVRVLAYGALLPTGGGGGDGQYIGATTPASGGILYGLQPGDTNGGIRLTLDNSNTGGVYEVVGPYTSPETVTTGVEIAVPLDVIGNPDCVRVTVFVNGQLHDYVSNQVLPSLPPGTGNLGDPRNVDFSALAGSQYFTVCAPGAVGVGNHPEVPDAHRMLHAPAPNPFLAVTTLSFSLDVDTVVDLRIFDIRGRLVRHLVQDQPYPGGIHAVTWDGRDDRGGALAAGVYHARFSAGAAIETRRLIYTR